MWIFERGPLPNNVHVDDSPGFHTLTIYEVQWNNAGTYTCIGSDEKVGDPDVLFEDDGVLIVIGILMHYYQMLSKFTTR